MTSGYIWVYIKGMVILSEPINVWAYFKRGSILPYIFFWNNRRIKIDKINLVHTSKFGSTLNYHFSVSSSGNFYKIKFDTKDFKWILEALEEDEGLVN